jgi:hypothetical protein
MEKASGKECRNAVASKIPTDTLTILFTILASKDKEKLAATNTLTVPASAVTNKILCNTDIKITLLHFS